MPEESGFRVLDQHGENATKMMYVFQAWWRAIVIYFRRVGFLQDHAGRARRVSRPRLTNGDRQRHTDAFGDQAAAFHS